MQINVKLEIIRNYSKFAKKKIKIVANYYVSIGTPFLFSSFSTNATSSSWCNNLVNLIFNVCKDV